MAKRAKPTTQSKTQAAAAKPSADQVTLCELAEANGPLGLVQRNDTASGKALSLPQARTPYYATKPGRAFERLPPRKGESFVSAFVAQRTVQVNVTKYLINANYGGNGNAIFIWVSSQAVDRWEG